MDEEEILVLNYLTENASGYDNRKSSEEIKQVCNLNAGGPTNDHIREIVRNLVNNHGCCIGSISWDRGYWIIETDAELKRVTDSLESRANKILDRAEILRTNWRNINNA
jgi:hypothetical protein